MHEVGLAFDIVELVDRFAAEHGVRQVECVHVDLGEYCGVLQHALEIGFEAARRESECCRAAALAVRTVVGSMRCEAYHAVAPTSPCPQCGAAQPRIVAGREFRLASIDF